MGKTEQEKSWSDEMGKQYTDRNILSLEEVKQLYIKEYGISRIEMNKEFLKEIPKESKILEIGCNAGNQLLILQKMGYMDLWAIELQEYAVKIARERTNIQNLLKASVFDIPFKDKYFDVVFTSGVLIHINPNDINRALDEIYRCSKSHIWGFEYYGRNDYIEIKYRDIDNLLWKTDFCRLFLERFSDLELIECKNYKYTYGNNEDSMYLLKKK